MADENPHQFSTQTTGVTFGQITDDTDFPHTGLIKSLSLMAKGNMAVKGSATDFDITQASSGNVIQVAAGRIFKDNKFTAQVAAKNFTSSAFDTTTGNSFYHLLVVDASNVLQVRKHGSSTANKVPEYTEGDTIIAVIMFNSSTAALGSMQIQFLTTGKVENSLSIGYDDSGYTEAGSLTGTSDGITMTGLYKLDTLPTATVATDDKLIIQDTNDSDKIKTVTAQSIANLASYSDSNAISAVEGEATLDLTGDVTIAAGKDLTVDTNTLHVDSANNRVGIRTTSPDMSLDVIQSGTTIARVASTGSHANLRFGRANSSYDAAMLFYDDMATTPSLQWRIQMTSGGSDLSIRDEDGSPDGQEIMKFKDGGGIDINCDVEMPVAHKLRTGEIEIEGDLNHDGSNVGFFGTAVASRQNVGNGSFVTNPVNFGRPVPDPSANPGFEPNVDNYIAQLENEIVTISTKLNDLIDALQLYGLIL